MRVRTALLLLEVLAGVLFGPGPTGANPLRPAGEPAEGVMSVSGPLTPVIQAINRAQAGAMRALNDGLRAFRDQGTVAAAVWLMTIAFAYGVVHAAGPGHGKFVVSSYFAANRARLVRGILAAVLIALVQALSAIVLVFLLVAALGATRMTTLEHVRVVELVGYGLIVGLGAVMLVDAVRGRTGCGHDPDHAHDHDGPHDPDHPHDDGHTPGHHDHGGSRCGHRHVPANVGGAGRLRLLGLGLAVGLRPCSGALILLFFALANDMAVVGVLAVLAMAAGVAVTTSAAGVLGMGARRAVLALAAGRARLAGTAERALRIAGGLAVTAAGALLLLSAV